MYIQMIVNRYRGKIEPILKGDTVTFIVKNRNGDSIFEIKVLTSDLGNMIYHDVDCEYLQSGVDIVDENKEIKSVEVFVAAGPWDKLEENIEEALLPFKSDGWVANTQDLKDPKRFIRHEEELGAYYNVRFSRYMKTA